ncbi:MAG: hypothetical protein ACYCXW_04720 [Solirubrobacteraceae bacterium]
MPSASELELGVIKDARRRQRRRRGALATVLLAAAVAAISIQTGAGGGGRTQRAQPSRSTSRSSVGGITPPQAVFVKEPYMGVSCHIPSSIACDRVGLAVWLRRPAVVSATIAGAPLTLNAPHWSYSVRDGRHMLYVYAGFLQPAGLTTRLHVIPESTTPTWLGGNAPSPLVRFWIDYGHGNVIVTQEHVWLYAGWG